MSKFETTGLEDFEGETGATSREELLSPSVEKTIDEVSRMLYDREYIVGQKASENATNLGLHEEAKMRRQFSGEIRELAKEFIRKYGEKPGRPTPEQLMSAFDRAKK